MFKKKTKKLKTPLTDGLQIVNCKVITNEIVEISFLSYSSHITGLLMIKWCATMCVLDKKKHFELYLFLIFNSQFNSILTYFGKCMHVECTHTRLT